MKLMVIIVRDADGDAVLEALLERGLRVTRVASTGGFFRHGNQTLLVGLQAEQVDEVLALLRSGLTPPAPDQHRATIFVADMVHFEQV